MACGALSTTVLPEASAGAALCATKLSGALNDVMPHTTPRGTRIVNAMRCAWPGAPSIGTTSPDQALAFFGGDQERLNGARHFVLRVGDREARFGGDRRARARRAAASIRSQARRRIV